MSGGLPADFGPFRLLRRLGAGGMAEVFLAETAAADGSPRLVACKRLHAAFGEDLAATQLLLEEARLAMRFDHPNIAQTFELGRHESGFYFLLEYVDGADLGSLQAVLEARGQRLPLGAVLWIGRAMANALAYAHTLTDERGEPLGVVHRDVSPQNILLSRRGDVKLIDFGVAKVASRLQHTAAGVIKGKYAYMSPEQANASAVDARSDIFSLAVCLHELLTGQPLFRALQGASPFAILRAVRETDAPPLFPDVPGVPADVAAVIAQALGRDPTLRTPSMQRLAEALDDCCQRHAPLWTADLLAAEVERLLALQSPQEAAAALQVPGLAAREFVASRISVVARAPTQAVALPARVPRGLVPVAVVPALPAQGPRRPAWWPSRRTLLPLLWVGGAALLLASGWGLMALWLRRSLHD